MPPITKRRTGRGFEREIQALQRLRTAIVLDERIAVDLHSKALEQIDALVTTLTKLMRLGINAADSTPPPPMVEEGEEPAIIRRRSRKTV